MADMVSYEQVAALAAQLSAKEKKELAEQLLIAVANSAGAASIRRGRKWSEIAGIAPNLMAGEDAQAWVSRTRQEDDEHRQSMLRSSREAG